MPHRPPSLRAISAFEAVARHGSFGKAAEELNLTPSALSHSIKALETRLGRKLFDRSAHATTLTESGVSVLTRVRVSLDLLQDALNAGPARGRGRLVISALPSIARKVIVPRLQSLRDELPGIELELHATTAVESVDGEIDVGVRFGPGGWRGVESRLIAEERHIVVASPGYWTAALPEHARDLLGSELLFDRESSWRLWLQHAGLRPEDFRKGPVITDSALMVDAAVGGAGVALARECLCRGEIAERSLVRLFDRALPSRNGYWTVWNGSSAKREIVQVFGSWLTRQLGSSQPVVS